MACVTSSGASRLVMILTVETRVGQQYTPLHVFLRRRRRRVLVHERVSYWEYDECYAKCLVENLHTKHDLLSMYSAITSSRFRFQVALFTANSRARQAHATLANHHASSTETAKGSVIYRTKVDFHSMYNTKQDVIFSSSPLSLVAVSYTHLTLPTIYSV